jgi:hypothetical protein
MVMTTASAGRATTLTPAEHQPHRHRQAAAPSSAPPSPPRQGDLPGSWMQGWGGGAPGSSSSLLARPRQASSRAAASFALPRPAGPGGGGWRVVPLISSPSPSPAPSCSHQALRQGTRRGQAGLPPRRSFCPLLLLPLCLEGERQERATRGTYIFSI